MSHKNKLPLAKNHLYFIVKASGDQTGSHDTDDIGHFVVNNRGYFGSPIEAQRIANRLAEETPGNRYYVCKAVTGHIYTGVTQVNFR